jgi:hypothetical protein
MRRFVIGVVTFGLAFALAVPAFATGKQVTVGTLTTSGNWIPFWGTSYNALRFQTLIDQTEIKYAGTINEVEYYAWHGYTSEFLKYRVLLGHTGLSALTTTFDNNWKGTPVEVANAPSFIIKATVKTWFPLKLTKTFTYNNTDNLVVEISWDGKRIAPGEAVYTCTFGSGYHRIYALGSSTAPTGSGSSLCYYCRLSFNAYVGVSPTSLGRVKALYQ